MLVALKLIGREAYAMDKNASKKANVAPWQAEDAARLKSIFESEHNTLSQLRFGAEYDLGSAAMVWQYLNGHRPLNITAAVAFARGLRCKVEDFSPALANQIAEAMMFARNAPQPSDQADTELHRLSKVEVHILTRFRLTDDGGRNDFLDVAETVPITAQQASEPIPISQSARRAGG